MRRYFDSNNHRFASWNKRREKPEIALGDQNKQLTPASRESRCFPSQTASPRYGQETSQGTKAVCAPLPNPPSYHIRDAIPEYEKEKVPKSDRK